MLYSVYSKWIVNKEEINDFDEARVYDNWVTIGNNLPPSEVIDIIETSQDSIFANEYIQIIIPDINFGDIVMNIKNGQKGIVKYFDQNPIENFYEKYCEDFPEGIISEEYVTVETTNGETLIWVLKDLIVMNN